MQYKFRAKRKDNCEWAYGSLTVEYDGTCHINYWVSKLIEPENNFWEMVHEMVEVVPETVGQWTGMMDKSGKEIYEGDILKSFSPSVPSYEVFYDKSSYRLRYKLKNGDWYNWGPLFRMEEIQWEGRLPLCPDVIGSIHEHPHLLNPAKGAVTHTMNNLDPNAQTAPANQQAAGQTNEQATAEQVAAVESDAQENAMESEEEGGAEG